MQAVRRLGTVLSTLFDVAWAAEQLALRGFLDELGPRSCQVRTDVETLRRRVDVIELEALS